MEKELSEFDVIVIGGGASGLMAAGEAAGAGARTIIIEKMSRPARKLRITGKGRCNLTNIAPIHEFIEHFGRNGRFLRQAFHQFFSKDLVSFFEERGVETVSERGGRVFPTSERAQQVVDALVAWNLKQGVHILTDIRATALRITDNRILGVEAVSSGSEAKTEQPRLYPTNSVILAAGGASYPATGSTGDGYRLAAEAGHTIESIRPALVPLKVEGRAPMLLNGLTLRNVSVAIFVQGKKVDTAFGEVEFIRSGISGAVILTFSKIAVDALQQNQSVRISIDLKPALDHGKLDQRLLRDFREFSNKSFQNILKGLLPSQMIPVCIEYTQIPGEIPAHQITADQRKRLRLWLKNFELEVTGYRPIDEALITAGGVKLSEVNPRTMESKLIQGLFFAGEVLDLDADTGGYNLQAAFSTGWIAGKSAAGYTLHLQNA